MYMNILLNINLLLRHAYILFFNIKAYTHTCIHIKIYLYLYIYIYM